MKTGALFPFNLVFLYKLRELLKSQPDSSRNSAAAFTSLIFLKISFERPFTNGYRIYPALENPPLTYEYTASCSSFCRKSTAIWLSTLLFLIPSRIEFPFSAHILIFLPIVNFYQAFHKGIVPFIKCFQQK